MNFKKAIIVITAAAIITGALAGCSQDNSAVNADPDSTSVSTEVQSTDAQVTEDTSAVITAETEVQSTKASSDTSSTAKSKTTAVSSKSTAKVSSAATKKTGKVSSKATTKKSGKASKATTKTTKSNKRKSTAAKAGSKTSKSAKGTTAKATTKAAAKTTAKASTTATTTAADTTVKINLIKNGNAECKSSNVTIDAPSGLATEGTIYIEKSGDYIITSSTDTWHGQIIIKLANTESASIRFENVNITSQKANVIKILDSNITAERSFIEADVSSGTAGGDVDNALRDEMKNVSKNEKAPNVDLSFPTGTTSSFSTGANSLSGVIYNESKLTVKGNGAVNISAANNRNNAVCSTKSITFKNVTTNLSTAANNSISALSSARGIFTFSKVYVESGKLNINSNGDGIRCEGFYSLGGTTNIKSSACDGIDADDAIDITGGSVTVKGLEKSCFKVRRINNQEKIDAGDKTIKASDGVIKATHTFKIDGGTVVAEGKNITTVQSASKQASITCRSVKSAGSLEAKKAIKFTIKGTGVNATSTDNCIKYLYSSSSIDTTKDYTVSSSGYTSKKVSFTGKVGDVRIEANK